LTCSVIISCYNEAGRLKEKAEQILALEGAASIVQLLIGSDGSTDHPEQALAGVVDPRLGLRCFPERRGKPAVLHDLIAQATGDVVIMMDVRQRVGQQALVALLANFADPEVGVVSGELRFVHHSEPGAPSSGVDAYWRYEKWIRRVEACYHSVPGATGALYAMRRELARPFSPDLVLDDVVLPMLAIAQGTRCVFERDAVVYDEPSRDLRRESIRKRRTLAGCVQVMVRWPRWFLPGGHPIWWQYGSHKVLRLYSPLFLALAFAASFVLRHQTPWAILTAMQCIFYASALTGLGLARRSRCPAVVRIPAVFIGMQWMVLQGWMDAATGRLRAAWEVASSR
jgi:cellulose synthase/poly-beta-1,6-N-acetylglucosamine synthase-like glycosyltransferase